MAYNNNDILGFAKKDAKYSIGVGRGSAMGNAIEWAIAKGLSLEEVFDISDKIFHYQQVKINEDYRNWERDELPKIKEELGMHDVVDVDKGEQLVFPTK